MIKKVLASVLCLSMVLACASCGSSADSSSATTTTTTSAAETTTTTSAADDAEEPADDAEGEDVEGEGDAEGEDDATGVDATAFVGTEWSATAVMSSDGNSATLEDYCEGTGEDINSYAMTISLTDETTCTMASATSDSTGTWEFDGQYLTVTDDTDGSSQQFEYDATQGAFAFPVADTLALILTQTA